jgi:alkylation response protein AidB-like acyl-CoA dehydrogenase
MVGGSRTDEGPQGVRFALTDDQSFFRETTRRYLEAKSPLTSVRQLWERSDGFEQDYWRQATDLGWASPFVPDRLGGGSISGRPLSDAVIVAEEMGRMVAPGPFLPVNVVAGALAAEGSEQQQAEILPGLLSGDSLASWALAEVGGRWSGVGPEISASAELRGGDVVVNGSKAYVEAAVQADQFLVIARTGTGLSQVLVPVEAAGCTVSAGRSIDLTRRFGRLDFDQVRLPMSALVGVPGRSDGSVEHELRVALVLQCAETVGAADKAFDMTVSFAGERYAFGRPIASFQALKHRIADMLQWLEFAKAVTDAAAAAIDDGDADAGRLVSVAKAYVGDHCLDIVDDCVQMTGGLGVTWEHDIHLFSRRIALNRALLGTPEQHKERLCVLMEV